MRESKFVPRAAFALTKAKVQNDGGLAVSYEVTETIGQDVYENEFTIKKGAEPAPELLECFVSLSPLVSHALGLARMKTSLKKEDFGATPEQVEIIDKAFAEWEDTLTVTGAVIAGEGEKRGVMAIATFGRVSVTTPKFTIPGNDTLVNLMQTLEDEVYQYIFCGKTAQLDLFDADGEPTPEALNQSDE